MQEVTFTLPVPEEGKVLKEIVSIVERTVIEIMLRKQNYNQVKTAKALGVNRNTLRARMKAFGLDV